MEHSLNNDVLTLYLKGEVNSSNSEAIEEQIRSIMESAQFSSVVFDLGELIYISSAGLRIILAVKREHADTKLIKASKDVYEIFEMVGFTNILDIEKA